MVPTASAPKINVKNASLQCFAERPQKPRQKQRFNQILREKYTAAQTAEDPEEHPVEFIDENGDDATEEDVNPVSKGN
jgi:hypothetical protein